MHYLVDGYNLLFRVLKKQGPLEKSRNTLISDLNEIASLTRMHIVLVFDGAKEIRLPTTRSHFDEIELVYTRKDQSADEYIIEELEYSKKPEKYTIVSNDSELQRKCHHLKAKSLSIDDFLAVLAKKKRAKKRKEIRPEVVFRESPSELNRLLTIFEKRLEEGDEQD
ncbi:MAG: NYN domain-containing protein [Chlamydiota bacterium]